ncbi:hypothetical protein B0J17DRAFT_625716 [Rhizoctonia solani]|nr:hypothetical protein B0J17DRAFT_625716 [Rhizoctonia solani]
MVQYQKGKIALIISVGNCQLITDIAYALYGLHGNNLITCLSDDCLNISKIIYSFNVRNLEAPGVFKENGTYYYVFSQKTRFHPNNAQLFTAPALTGLWTRQPQLAPNGTNTWESQNTFKFTIRGTKKTTHIFMGDQWDCDKLGDSQHMWLPLTIGRTQAPSLEWHNFWRVNIKTGKVSYPKGTSYEAEKGVIAGGATITSCVTCSGGSYVTSRKPQWLAIYYLNTDLQTTALHRYASVSVNGAVGDVVKQRTTAEGVVVSVPLQVQFAKGLENNVTISGLSGSVESAWLDRVLVY